MSKSVELITAAIIAAEEELLEASVRLDQLRMLLDGERPVRRKPGRPRKLTVTSKPMSIVAEVVGMGTTPGRRGWTPEQKRAQGLRAARMWRKRRAATRKTAKG